MLFIHSFLFGRDSHKKEFNSGIIQNVKELKFGRWLLLLKMKNMHWELIANVLHYGAKPPK